MPAPFTTQLTYRRREDKPAYVADKYGPILTGRILDAGGDRGRLRALLPPRADYLCAGLGGDEDLQLDLEQTPLPFGDNEFDCVLCLDVLEHLDTPHATFDELCRVTRRWLIVALPNPFGDFWHTLRHGDWRPGRLFKFYGLQPDPPEDRHKWFFSGLDAERFIEHRAGLCGMRVAQMDYSPRAVDDFAGLAGRLRWWLLKRLAHPDFPVEQLAKGSLWAVLEKGIG